MSEGSLFAVVGLWLAVGASVAVLLLRQGHPPETVLMAIVAWPLAAPLVGGRDPAVGERSRVHGPLAARVEVAVARLGAALGEGADLSILDTLRHELLRVDEHLGRLDALLADAVDLPEADVAELRAARARTEAGLIEAIEALGRLRVRVKLAELAADGPPVASPLAELHARVRALDEVGEVHDPKVTTAG